MVVTNDDEVATKLKLSRDHGRNEQGEVVVWGCNSRLDNIQAAILSFFLKNYEDVVWKRRHLSSLYHKYLNDVDDLILPPPPIENGVNFDIYQNYEIETSYRDQLQEFLKENGVGTLRQWGGKVVHQFKALGFALDLPFTERMIDRSLMLPLNMSLSDNDVEYVCEQIHDFYRKV